MIDRRLLEDCYEESLEVMSNVYRIHLNPLTLPNPKLSAGSCLWTLNSTDLHQNHLEQDIRNSMAMTRCRRADSSVRHGPI